MKITIHDNTIDRINSMLEDSTKNCIRIQAKGSCWGGLNLEVVLDEQRENDDVVIDKGVKIVVDKSLSHFFTDATIEYKNTFLGYAFKVY